MSDAAEQAPKKKSKLMLFVIIGVLVLVIAGAGVGFLLMKKKPADEDGEDAPAAHAKADEKKHAAPAGAPPVYVKLEPFVTNLASENPNEAQFIQITVELKVDDAHVGDQLKPYTPEIRNGVLRTLSSKKSSQLVSPEGKDALAEEIQRVVNVIVNPPKKKGGEPDGPVNAVLFSSFVIQ